MSNEIITVPQLTNLFNAKLKEIHAILPSQFDEKRMCRIVITEFERNKDLQLCTKRSILGAFLQSAQLGLTPDPVTGEAYLIPYDVTDRKTGTKTKICQFIIGYKGLMTLAYRTGKILYMDAREICENDKLAFQYGSDLYINHNYKLTEPRGKVIAYYGGVKLANGEYKFEILTLDKVNKHKAHASTKKVWDAHPEEMAQKTAIKVVLKYIEKSTENLNLSQALAVDDRVESGIHDLGDAIDVTDYEKEKPVSRTAEITQKLQGDK